MASITNFKRIKNEIFVISSYLGIFKNFAAAKPKWITKLNYCKKIDKKFNINNSLRDKEIKNKKDDFF